MLRLKKMLRSREIRFKKENEGRERDQETEVK